MNRPWITISAAMSLDGCLDDTSDRRLILSSAGDLQAVDVLRAAHDAILVGAATLRKDNSRLLIKADHLREQRRARGASPDLVKATITRSGNLEPGLLFFQTGEAEKIVYCPHRIQGDLQKRFKDVARVVALPEPDDMLAFLLDDLARRGIQKLLVEGGQETLSLFLQAGVLDELRIAIAPFIVGQADAPHLILPGAYPFSANSRLQMHKVENIQGMAVIWLRKA